MTALTGWPGAPGYPENPERSGAHVIHFFNHDETWLWVAHREWWIDATGKFLSATEVGLAVGCAYLGPILTPAEVAARAAAAREAGMREAAGIAETHEVLAHQAPAREIAAAIRAAMEKEGGA